MARRAWPSSTCRSSAQPSNWPTRRRSDPARGLRRRRDRRRRHAFARPARCLDQLVGLSGPQTFDGDKTLAGELSASGAVASISTAAGTATYGPGTGAAAALGTGAPRAPTPSSTPTPTRADGTTVIGTPTVTFANGVTRVSMPQANLTALLLGLGGAVADAFKRLNVNTPAVPLNHAGSSIEATVNKNSVGNGAAFAFRTGFGVPSPSIAPASTSRPTSDHARGGNRRRGHGQFLILSPEDSTMTPPHYSRGTAHRSDADLEAMLARAAEEGAPRALNDESGRLWNVS
jgi:hypothetical protein